jgi:hypothetical protein
MAFSKRFPKDVPGSRFPEWVDVALTDAEEAKVEAEARQEHIREMRSCLADAKQILQDEHLKDYQTNLVRLATALFEKRSSHVVWHKEEAARQKFEREN